MVIGLLIYRREKGKKTKLVIAWKLGNLPQTFPTAACPTLSSNTSSKLAFLKNVTRLQKPISSKLKQFSTVKERYGTNYRHLAVT